MSNGLKFEVGSMYKNMKGVFEVLSIHRDSMTIRWDDGSELSTSADLQKRIIERMAFDEKLEQANQTEKVKPTRRSAKSKA
jgi:hypothetical protein